MYRNGQWWVSALKGISILGMVIGAVWFVKGSIDESNTKIDNANAKIEQLQKNDGEKGEQIKSLEASAVALTISINRLSDIVQERMPRPFDAQPDNLMTPKVIK